MCQLQLSPTTLITGGSDGRVITFSLENLSISNRIAAHDCSVTSLQFVDDGGMGPWNPQPRPLPPTSLTSAEDSEAGQSTQDGFKGVMGSRTVQKKSSGGFLVTGGNDGKVRLYEVETGNYVRDVSEGGDSVWKVCVGWGICVVVCKRGGKTVVEIWSMRPDEEKGEGKANAKLPIGNGESRREMRIFEGEDV